MAEEALHVGDRHALGKQAGGHGMAQEMRVEVLGDARRNGHLVHHLADALSAVDPQPGELGADRHLAALDIEPQISVVFFQRTLRA